MSILRITLDSLKFLGQPAKAAAGTTPGDPVTSARITCTPAVDGAAVMAAGVHTVTPEVITASAITDTTPWTYDLVDPTDATPTGWGWTITIAPAGGGEPLVASLTAAVIAALPATDGVRTARLEDWIQTGTPGSQPGVTITTLKVAAGTSPGQALTLDSSGAVVVGVNASTALSVGSVTTGAPGSNAAASFTGSWPNQALNLTIPQGIAGQPSTYELRGTGSPYNSVTPPGPGYYYTDTAGTCGAWRWMSTGTSKTSWIVTIGDTGWRNVPIDNTMWTNYLTMRRVVNRVIVSGFRNLAVDGSGADPKVNPFIPAGVLPSGFLPSLWSETFTISGDSPGTLNNSRTGYVTHDGALYYVPNWPTAHLLGSYESETVWPTTLPGIAA